MAIGRFGPYVRYGKKFVSLPAGVDPLSLDLDEAVEFVTQTRKASISSVQRKLRIGYKRAARLVEGMEAAGVVSEAGHNGAREVLAPAPPRRSSGTCS